MKTLFATPIVAILAIAGSTACATKEYVRTSVEPVAEQVASLRDAVEGTQEQARKTDARIVQVDAEVKSVQASAQRASQSAQEATSLARTVQTKTEAIETAGRRVVYETVLTEDDVTFGFDDAELSDAAKQELAALVQALRLQPRDVSIAIEGHTDSTGARALNERLGLERAEAVERYLYEEHDIPLTKMDVISYGEDKPVAPNTTREGRAQNRRVVIKVMA
jgi:outer membrane protein OmpA-like peptidoglycan-associated protein